LREWVEEVGAPLDDFAVVSVHEDDHGGWSYWTVVDLDLHDAFRSTLVRLGLLPGSGADEGSGPGEARARFS
jgi:hypothetical protein